MLCIVVPQPRTQACSRYPSGQRRLGTERDSARRPGRIFPTSLTGDVTSEIAEDDWERGWLCPIGEQFLLSSSRELVQVLENFRPAFSPYPTDCPWVSEDVP